MAYLIAIILIIAVLFVMVKMVLGAGGNVEKPKYEYKRKQFFMTRAEHEFYDQLVEAVGNEYYIFAQVHLPTIVDHTVRGQNWQAALAHINRKSVDFVLCDKAYISPKLVIELDDSSHERQDRKERDEEVERILNYVELPLLRIENHGQFYSDDMANKIREAVK